MYRQNLPDRRWVPLPFHPEIDAEQRDRSVSEMRGRLLTDPILTGVARDCDVQGRWDLASEEAALAELKARVFVEAGEMIFSGVPAHTLNIGFRGVAGEKDYLDRLSERLMEDVRRLVDPTQSGGAAQPTKF
ncbi:MAG: hypothetical protein EAZ84_01235 [Verrucomicrobia bacterium]|nr:MAG: hypothetical protein EAZ84_01235 [Verrucomicrobiota bacterium]